MIERLLLHPAAESVLWMFVIVIVGVLVIYGAIRLLDTITDHLTAISAAIDLREREDME